MTCPPVAGTQVRLDCCDEHHIHMSFPANSLQPVGDEAVGLPGMHWLTALRLGVELQKAAAAAAVAVGFTPTEYVTAAIQITAEVTTR